MVTLAEFPAVLRDTARSLRAAGDTDLARQLAKAIKTGAQPVLAEIRTELPSFMPNRYAGVLTRDLLLTSSVRLSGAAGATVQLKAATRSGRQRKLRQLDQQGVLTHPFFGDRKHWYSQRAGVRAGFFSKPAMDSRAQIRGRIKAAMDQVADDAARRAL